MLLDFYTNQYNIITTFLSVSVCSSCNLLVLFSALSFGLQVFYFCLQIFIACFCWLFYNCLLLVYHYRCGCSLALYCRWVWIIFLAVVSYVLSISFRLFLWLYDIHLTHVAVVVGDFGCYF